VRRSSVVAALMIVHFLMPVQLTDGLVLQLMLRRNTDNTNDVSVCQSSSRSTEVTDLSVFTCEELPPCNVAWLNTLERGGVCFDQTERFSERM